MRVSVGCDKMQTIRCLPHTVSLLNWTCQCGSSVGVSGVYVEGGHCTTQVVAHHASPVVHDLLIRGEETHLLHLITSTDSMHQFFSSNARKIPGFDISRDKWQVR